MSLIRELSLAWNILMGLFLMASLDSFLVLLISGYGETKSFTLVRICRCSSTRACFVRVFSSCICLFIRYIYQSYHSGLQLYRSKPQQKKKRKKKNSVYIIENLLLNELTWNWFSGKKWIARRRSAAMFKRKFQNARFV